MLALLVSSLVGYISASDPCGWGYTHLSLIHSVLDPVPLALDGESVFYLYIGPSSCTVAQHLLDATRGKELTFWLPGLLMEVVPCRGADAYLFIGLSSFALVV